MESAKREYIHANKALRKVTGAEGELKAANLSAKHKRSLFKAVEDYDTICGVVEISRVYNHILANKRSICRYKDYVLKRVVKQQLISYIEKGIISRDQDIDIYISIDEQLTATNGYYNLSDSISEELQHGIRNWDYGVVHSRVFSGEVNVYIEYCDSSKNYLIQASDIIANRIWTSYRVDNPSLRDIHNHTVLTFP